MQHLSFRSLVEILVDIKINFLMEQMNSVEGYRATSLKEFDQSRLCFRITYKNIDLYN